MRLPRVTVRCLIYCVAITGILLGLGIWLKRRSDHYWAIANYHAGRSQQESQMVVGVAQEMFEVWNNTGMWHKEMRKKYEYARRRPWIWVPSEPLEPPEPPRTIPTDPDAPVLP
jgi:hypothetical protein